MMDPMSSYFNIYLDQLGFTKTMIGTVSAVSSLAAMLCQPVGGALMDRAQSRRRMLQLLILLTAALYPLLLLNSSFVYILGIYTVYFTFRRLQPAVNTALSVEFAEENGRDYGPIRMMGAIGYTLMMVLVSRVAGMEKGVERTFGLYSAVCLFNVLLLFLLPPMPGHNKSPRESRVSPLSLLKSRSVKLLILYHVLIATANGISQTFFPIYATGDMGVSNSLYGIMVATGSTDYRLARILAFVDPQKYQQSAAYQNIRAKQAIGAGQMTGVGTFLPGSWATLGYVPENSTDFIFTVVGESFGFVGCMAVIAAYMFITLRMIYLARFTQDKFGRLVIIGVMAMLFFHVFQNIAMNVGVMPITGIPLPFLSYGGSNFITNIAAVALVLNVTRSRTTMTDLNIPVSKLNKGRKRKKAR